MRDNLRHTHIVESFEMLSETVIFIISNSYRNQYDLDRYEIKKTKCRAYISFIDIEDKELAAAILSYRLQREIRLELGKDFFQFKIIFPFQSN